MGGAAATLYDFDSAHLSRDELAMARVMMPLYFSDEPITEVEKLAAKGTFDMIINNNSQRFMKYKEDYPNTECITAVDFMHACFFQRLFNIHPSCKAMFKNGTKKMNLVPIISLFFEKMDHPAQLQASLHGFVDSHCKLGVKAVECK